MKGAFEDIEVGEARETARRTVTKAEILAFAEEFDPQIFHLDEEAAKQTVFRGLCASGWHTASLMMRLQMDAWKSDYSLGSPGFDDLRWLKPLRPGDTIHVRATCIDKTPSRSKPDRGSARWKTEVVNQKGEVVLDAELIGIYRKRGAD
ncbi:MaoC family dehydratase [Minwuia thermotolerans]|uniref:Acyl dehydratase n=1 Tax=Minwuia thermotolerans TaxID=2056226 RepID=A0A2M9FVP0_9PROT|nr:MaoC family dehydratase [Minwuia thermotolerans]PJK27538.1 acyl dehydratase [Minwuia thermotolerans]